MPDNDTEVAIIGGGAAGIAAARALARASVPSLLIEARERLGGRAFTVTDPAGHALDLGCGWLHSADRNPWAPIAEEQRRAIDKTLPPWTRAFDQPGFPAEEQRRFRAASNAFFDRLGTLPPDGPDVAAAEMLEPGGRWNGLIAAVGSYISGGELDQVSARDFDNYADTGVNWRVAEGYGTVVASAGHDSPVVLGCPVTRIDRSGRRLRIETAKGTVTADCAIVTLPTAVLAAMEDLFAPALPEKIVAARGLPLGLNDKLFLSLSDAEAFAPDSRLFGRTDTADTATYHVRPFGRPLIEVYFGGRLPRELEADGERAFFAFARDELVGLLGSEFAQRIAPVRIHLWGADPYARGSYSYALPGKVECRAALAAPVDDRLFFAGEACSTYDYSTAHGAYLTGIAAAEQAIAARRR